MLCENFRGIAPAATAGSTLGPLVMLGSCWFILSKLAATASISELISAVTTASGFGTGSPVVESGPPAGGVAEDDLGKNDSSGIDLKGSPEAAAAATPSNSFLTLKKREMHNYCSWKADHYLAMVCIALDSYSVNVTEKSS